MIWVESAEHAGGYRLQLRFSDGAEGTVELREFVFRDERPVFRELRDPQVFRSFRVEWDTVVWDNGADLAPEFLYTLAGIAHPQPQPA